MGLSESESAQTRSGCDPSESGNGLKGVENGSVRGRARGHGYATRHSEGIQYGSEMLIRVENLHENQSLHASASVNAKESEMTHELGLMLEGLGHASVSAHVHGYGHDHASANDPKLIY